MAQQYINIRVILDRIMRHPLLTGLSLETAIDYTLDLMRIIGVPKMFIDKVEEIKVENYRAKLPCDFVEDIQLEHKGIPLRGATNSFHVDQTPHPSYKRPHPPRTDYTYSIQGGLIYTSIPHGILRLSYRAIKVDDEGLPMLPDNPSFLLALEWYIKMNYFNILFDMGEISGSVLQNAQQQYSFRVGQAETDMLRLSLSEMESFSNSIRTLIPREYDFNKEFKNTNQKQIIRTHG